MTSTSAKTPPVAAIDIGSNTIHLVVAQPLPAGATADITDLTILADETALVRLGADVTATGAIGAERTAIALATLRQQVATAQRLGASTILGVATEGVRAASNGADFLRRVEQETGVRFALVSGEQEAALTFWGATSGHPLAGTSAVVDLGGGSLELVVGDATRVMWRVSLPLGSGALRDRLAPADPADPAQLALVDRTVSEALDPLAVPLPVSEATACGGSATTLAALAQRALPNLAPLAPQPEIVPAAPAQQTPLPALNDERLVELVALLQRMSAAEVARHYGIEAERARLLGAGATILRAALRRLGAGALLVSRRGIREGAILAYARSGAGWLDAATRG